MANNLILMRRALGVCTRCGGRRDRDDLVTCSVCREKNRVSTKRSYAKNPIKCQESVYRRYEALKAAGKCVICGHADSMAGKTICEKCAIKKRAYQKTYDAKKKLMEAEEDALLRSVYCYAVADGVHDIV